VALVPQVGALVQLRDGGWGVLRQALAEEIGEEVVVAVPAALVVQRDELRMRQPARTGLARGIRRCGLRQAHFVDLAKSRLQHILTAVAIDFRRIGAWLSDIPRAQIRSAPFARLTRG
jgi:hypothetical protein